MSELQELSAPDVDSNEVSDDELKPSPPPVDQMFKVRKSNIRRGGLGVFLSDEFDEVKPNMCLFHYEFSASYTDAEIEAMDAIEYRRKQNGRFMVRNSQGISFDASETPATNVGKYINTLFERDLDSGKDFNCVLLEDEKGHPVIFSLLTIKGGDELYLDYRDPCPAKRKCNSEEVYEPHHKPKRQRLTRGRHNCSLNRDVPHVVTTDVDITARAATVASHPSSSRSTPVSLLRSRRSSSMSKDKVAVCNSSSLFPSTSETTESIPCHVSDNDVRTEVDILTHFCKCLQATLVVGEEQDHWALYSSMLQPVVDCVLSKNLTLGQQQQCLPIMSALPGGLWALLAQTSSHNLMYEIAERWQHPLRAWVHAPSMITSSQELADDWAPLSVPWCSDKYRLLAFCQFFQSAASFSLATTQDQVQIPFDKRVLAVMYQGLHAYCVNLQTAIQYQTCSIRTTDETCWLLFMTRMLKIIPNAIHVFTRLQHTFPLLFKCFSVDKGQ